MFILTIGIYHFAVPSAAIAAAIQDALSAAPQIKCSDNKRRVEDQFWLPVMYPAALALTSAHPASVIVPQAAPIPANVTAVLGEPTESRARTHRILSMAAADHSRAVADHHNTQN